MNPLLASPCLNLDCSASIADHSGVLGQIYFVSHDTVSTRMIGYLAEVTTQLGDLERETRNMRTALAALKEGQALDDSRSSRKTIRALEDQLETIRHKAEARSSEKLELEKLLGQVKTAVETLCTTTGASTAIEMHSLSNATLMKFFGMLESRISSLMASSRSSAAQRLTPGPSRYGPGTQLSVDNMAKLLSSTGSQVSTSGGDQGSAQLPRVPSAAAMSRTQVKSEDSIDMARMKRLVGVVTAESDSESNEDPYADSDDEIDAQPLSRSALKSRAEQRVRDLDADSPPAAVRSQAGAEEEKRKDNVRMPPVAGGTTKRRIPMPGPRGSSMANISAAKSAAVKLKR